jgi:hypothetical protein
MEKIKSLIKLALITGVISLLFLIISLFALSDIHSAGESFNIAWRILILCISVDFLFNIIVIIVLLKIRKFLKYKVSQGYRGYKKISGLESDQELLL